MPEFSGMSVYMILLITGFKSLKNLTGGIYGSIGSDFDKTQYKKI